MPKTKLIAGYVDPEWTKIIQERNEKASNKRHLSQDRKNLLAGDKIIKAMAKEGKSLDPMEKVLSLNMTYGMNNTVKNFYYPEASLNRSRSPEQSALRKQS